MENIRVSQSAEISDKPSLRQRVIALIKLHSSPREIALGVAIGVFIAITPLYGIHTVMVIVAAFLVKRANKLAIFLGTSVSTTLTFPFITWAGYSIGRFILGDGYPALHWPSFKHFDYKQLLHFYFPLFIGSVILGLALAVSAYFVTLGFIIVRRRLKSKQGRKDEGNAEK
jgi:uncharacterized protein (TIGR03546 family)